MNAVGFGTLFAVRAVAGAGSFADGLPFAQVPVGLMLIGIAVAGVLGGAVAVVSEIQVGRSAQLFGVHLRTQLAADLVGIEWEELEPEFTERPGAVANQVLVQGVREITLAAREVVRLVGPCTTLLVSAVVLIIVEPVAMIAMVIFAALSGWILLWQAGRTEALQRGFSESMDTNRLVVADGMAEVLDGNPHGLAVGLASAELGDRVSHERMLDPVRTRAVGLAATALLVSLVAVLFAVRSDSGEPIDILPLIVVLIALRLAGSAATRLAGSFSNVAKRSIAIDRYRRLAAEADVLQRLRLARSGKQYSGSDDFADDLRGSSHAI